jgi:nucleoside-diphosphate-sugar epimerase
MNSIKILITGAGGFLGYYIAKELVKNPNYEIISFSRNSYEKLQKLNIKERLGDLRNYDDVEKALTGVNWVIHTASLVGMWGKYEDFYQTNVLGTQNIIKASIKNNVSKIVYTSTPSVVFGSESLQGVDESTPYPNKYLSFYAQTKSIAEQLILKNNSNYISTVALRPHLIFGPGDQNLIPRVIEAQRKNKLKIIGDGENLVDVTYVENAALAHVLAAEQLNSSSKIAGKAYFVGQGPVKLWDFTNDILVRSGLPKVSKTISFKKAYLIGQIIELILKTFRIYNIHPPMTRFIALQLAKSHYYNHHNLEQDLAFKPRFTIKEGLDKLFSESVN